MTTVHIIDCKNLRVKRQKENNETMLRLLQNGDIEELKKECNNRELNRLSEYLDMYKEDLLLECADSNNILLAKLLARQISKKSYRQGTKDEKFVLQKCNETTSAAGVNIKNLSTRAFRPVKNDSRI